jgi:hypothetical protein
MTCLSLLRFVVPVSLCALACGGSAEGDDVGSRATGDGTDAGTPQGDDDRAGSSDDDDTGDDDSSDDDTGDDDSGDDDTGDDDDTPSDDDVPSTLDGPINLPDTDAADLAPPEDLLPDTPPETPVSDLSDEEFEDLCDPYLGEATTAISGLEGLCAFAGISAATESSAATVEEFQAACGEARIQCETDTAAAQVVAESLECTRPEDCTATVAEVEACYQQLYLLNGVILGPVGGAEFPPCEELTPTAAGIIVAQVGLYVLANAALAADATGMPVDVEGDPCQDLETTCPGLGVPSDVVPE